MIPRAFDRAECVSFWRGKVAAGGDKIVPHKKKAAHKKRAQKIMRFCSFIIVSLFRCFPIFINSISRCCVDRSGLYSYLIVLGFCFLNDWTPRLQYSFSYAVGGSEGSLLLLDLGTTLSFPQLILSTLENYRYHSLFFPLNLWVLQVPLTLFSH